VMRASFEMDLYQQLSYAWCKVSLNHRQRRKGRHQDATNRSGARYPQRARTWPALQRVRSEKDCGKQAEDVASLRVEWLFRCIIRLVMYGDVLHR
jgi:hypothetical protein